MEWLLSMLSTCLPNAPQPPTHNMFRLITNIQPQEWICSHCSIGIENSQFDIIHLESYLFTSSRVSPSHPVLKLIQGQLNSAPMLTTRLYHTTSTSLYANSQRLTRQLSDLFRVTPARRQLSHRFRIMPHYLQPSMVRKFTKGKHYQHYLRHAVEQNNLHNVLEEHPFECGQLVGFLGLRGGKGILEGFLNWLISQPEQSSFQHYQNDYTIEMCRFLRPDKWFQVKHEGTEKRVFIYHHGPTNSGKSTSAIAQLKALSSHQKGIYMAPLRLLAWQYQQKLGKCNLITGQEKEYTNSNLVSCTIEAAPLNEDYQVAVIDEIQMMADQERGWAWTKAILTLKAKRIHLCGDERALGVVSRILELTGDRLEERRYSRLSKLSLMHKLFDLKKISPGDAIINFSKDALVRHRNDINSMIYDTTPSQKQQTPSPEGQSASIRIPNKTAMVYGRLPSQVRKQQAMSFNEGQLPYLVATNAIGMGLNLNIKKIVFISLHRNARQGIMQQLEEHQIQQIAGRAGRGQQTGYVQCTTNAILHKVRKALRNVNKAYGIQLEEGEQEQGESEVQETGEKKEEGERWSKLLGRTLTKKECHIDKACLFFLVAYLMQFKMQLQSITGEINLLDLLDYLRDYVQLSDLYFLQANRMFGYLINLLQTSNYDIEQLFTFYNGLSLSLVSATRRSSTRRQIQYYHKQFINNFIKYRRVPLPQTLLQMHNSNYREYTTMQCLDELQSYYSLLQSYIWLWNKFQFVFYQIVKAKEIKNALAKRINMVVCQNRFKKYQKKVGKDRYQSFRSKNNKPKKRKHKKEVGQEFVVRIENTAKKGILAQSGITITEDNDPEEEERWEELPTEKSRNKKNRLQPQPTKGKKKKSEDYIDEECMQETAQAIAQHIFRNTHRK